MTGLPPTSGGITFTLTGTHLAQATAVLVGGSPAGFTVVSDSHIVVDAPPGAPGRSMSRSPRPAASALR
ncbi:IPT/TIG domain-containing protein [Streptomyces decoyicus]